LTPGRWRRCGRLRCDRRGSDHRSQSRSAPSRRNSAVRARLAFSV
jgi:hypothetical protein